MDTVIAEFQKNAVEKVRIAVREFKGRILLDLRIYYQDEAGAWLPTKKGLALTVEQWPDLREALAKVDAHLPAEPSRPGCQRSRRRGGPP